MRSSLGIFSVGVVSVTACALYACGTGGGGGTFTVVPPDGASDAPTEGSLIPDGSGADAAAPKPLFATRIGAGKSHACLVRADGTIACWGHNTALQLGVVDAGGEYSAVPVRATTLTGAVATFGTFATSCALLDTAQLGCWGSNSQGLLGNLAAPSFSAVPANVGNLDDVVAATGGDVHACLLRVGGKAFCWGANEDEQLGSGVPGAGPSGAPAPVQAPAGLKFIGSGSTSRHTCAIRDDDQVICWGQNNKTGQLGAPTFTEIESPTPLLVDNVQDAIVVATGSDHSCAIRKGGTMRCWGANDEGQVGFGAAGDGGTEKLAQDVPGVADAVALSLGDKRTCIVRSTGKVSCWGDNTNGGLGIGSTTPLRTVTPLDVAGITDATAVALGDGFGCALRANGKVSCWGSNDKGQLGSGVVDAGAFSATPLEVPGL